MLVRRPPDFWQRKRHGPTFQPPDKGGPRLPGLPYRGASPSGWLAARMRPLNLCGPFGSG